MIWFVALVFKHFPMIKFKSHLVLMSLALMGACSSKDASLSDKTQDPKSAVSADKKAQEKPDPEMVSTLNSIEASANSGKLDDAVVQLTVLSKLPKNDADDQKYRETYYKVQETLRKKAETDPNARESLKTLGRLMTGR